MKTEVFDIRTNNLFFTSDLHLAHDRIIEYCDRPFSDVYEMNQVLIDNWNYKINKTDIVFVLGDFCFGGQKIWLDFIYRLNGFIYLIRGNHDKSVPKQTNHLEDKFIYKEGFLNIRIRDEEFDGNEQKLTLCHYPMMSWYQSHRGSWNLFGHIHSGPRNKNQKESLPIRSSQYDVGVDNNNFTPLSWDEIKVILTKQLRS